jgi:hypothetical protein
MNAEIGIVDAVLIQQRLAQVDPEPFEPALADVDRDGEITIVDAVLIQQYLAGIIDKGALNVTDVSVGGTPTDRSTDVVDRTALTDRQDDTATNSETELIVADLENDGGIGKLQGAELRIAADEAGLDDPSAVVATPAVDVAPNDDLTVGFVVPEDELTDGDWIGIYTDDDQMKIQL